MWADPEFRALRAVGRDTSSEGLFGCRLAHKVDQFVNSLQDLSQEERARRLLSNVANSPYEIGVDWGQPFTFKTYSLGIVTLRWAAHSVCGGGGGAHAKPSAWAARHSTVLPYVHLAVHASLHAAAHVCAHEPGGTWIVSIV